MIMSGRCVGSLRIITLLLWSLCKTRDNHQSVYHTFLLDASQSHKAHPNKYQRSQQQLPYLSIINHISFCSSSADQNPLPWDPLEATPAVAAAA